MTCEVGELSFPVGAAERWLTAVLVDDHEQRTVAQLFDTLEGTVDAHRTGDAFRARIVLVDAAFFQAGTWFSGSDRSGKLSELAGGRRKVGEASARVVSTWIGEASAVFDQDMKGLFRPTPLQKPSAKATLEKKSGAPTKKVRTKKKAATRR
ncbi:MAG: hypothetical protein JNL79_16780 [Myxococcales bacterium]|nr:hypothetical protein [Myxococcales bacterium]